MKKKRVTRQMRDLIKSLKALGIPMQRVSLCKKSDSYISFNSSNFHINSDFSVIKLVGYGR